VTKEFYIGSQSIPFKFVDLPNPRKGLIVTSTQNPGRGDCTRKFDGPVVLTGNAPSTAASALVNATMNSGPPQRVALTGPRLMGQVAVGDWWHSGLTVPKGATHLRVRLVFEGSAKAAAAGTAGSESVLRANNNDRQLNLHLVSPSNKHYGWYGDTTGYSGQGTNPEEFDIPSPEEGTWRVSVQGTKGTGEAMSFDIESAMPVPPSKPQARATPTWPRRGR